MAMFCLNVEISWVVDVWQVVFKEVVVYSYLCSWQTWKGFLFMIKDLQSFFVERI